ncbi:MAG TPA: hypothetical protein VKF32_02345 [Thermoanaerobaculia bacterium]|nr:hypothetical protein [Thermoanaerobaculia bacterium]
MKTARVASALLVLSLSGRVARSQRVGPEFRVNTYSTNYQKLPAVAVDGAGNFVVVWQSAHPQDGSYVSAFGQRFSSTGAPVGGEFRANPFTADYQSGAPAVASDSTGNFVVVWQTFGLDGSSYGIFGQRYASSGAPLGTGFPANTSTLGGQQNARVASSATADFVVVWTDLSGADGNGAGVSGQRYASSGAPLGGEFRVNTYTTGSQTDPDVASSSSGGFVVVWTDGGQDGSISGVFGQRYASSGARLGIEFRVNTFTSQHQASPKVASDPTGNFVVVWQSFEEDGSSYGVFGQRYAAAGQPLGGEFRINTYTNSRQGAPAVASDSLGNIFVVWDDNNHDGSGYGLFGRFFDSAGARIGAQFRINSTTTGTQRSPNVAALSTNQFVVVWNGYTGPNNGEIFGQRFQACRSSDINGDTKIDVNDVFHLINALFAGGPPPVCGGDVNDDGRTDVADVFYLINFLFAGGPPPA